MDGKLKMIGIIAFIALFYNCKKQVNIENIGRELITQNINILIDSIEIFDTRNIKRPKKFENIKIKQITIGILDTIIIENNKDELSVFNLNKNDLINFKSQYRINIVKRNNYDANVLFVKFSNFHLNEDNANVIVKMNVGISMIKNKYYFKKENGIWVFKKKKLLSVG